MLQCEKRGLEDFVQITGLGDTMAVPATVFGSLCGLDTKAGECECGPWAMWQR